MVVILPLLRSILQYLLRWLIFITPLDWKACHTRLLRQYHPPYLVHIQWLRWSSQLIVRLGIFIVHIISHPHKFLLSVGARNQYYRHTQNIVFGYLTNVGCIGMQFKLVYAHGYRTNEYLIQDLIVRSILGGANV